MRVSGFRFRVHRVLGFMGFIGLMGFIGFIGCIGCRVQGKGLQGSRVTSGLRSLKLRLGVKGFGLRS